MANDLAGHYRSARLRLSELARSLDADAQATPVPACPGWTVRDTFAHLVALPADALAGRISGVPDEEFTAEQVIRFAGSTAELADSWDESGPQIEALLADGLRVPALVIDLHTHEQDILGALGRVGARDLPGTQWAIAAVTGAYPGIPVEPWEAWRARLGRRSRAQVEAWDWAPDTDLSDFFVFGPRDSDLIE